MQVVVAALFAAQDAIPASVNSFELFGFDVMMDSSLKVWIIEVNSSPSLSLDTPLDRVVKPAMMRDLLRLVDPLAFDREALAEALSARTSSKGEWVAGRGGGVHGSCLVAPVDWCVQSCGCCPGH